MVLDLRFIFPQNYHFHTRILGFFDYPTLVFNLIWFVFLFVISNILFKSIEIKIVFCTSLFLPIFLISFIYLKQENVFSFFMSIYHFLKSRRIYFYSKIR